MLQVYMYVHVHVHVYVNVCEYVCKYVCEYVCKYECAEWEWLECIRTGTGAGSQRAALPSQYPHIKRIGYFTRFHMRISYLAGLAWY